MKYFHTHLKLFLLFGVFAVFSSCKKDEPYDPSKEMDDYFEGKVNGVEFDPNGEWGCSWISGAYYSEPYLNFDAGYFHVSIRNCDSGESVIIGTYSGVEEGVFTTCSASDSTGPRGEYANILADIPGQQGSTVLHANDCQSIRLEITRLESSSSTSGYIEGTLDATVRDIELDTTIVISDVKFGYNY